MSLPTNAPTPSKAASSRLLTMKFMQKPTSNTSTHNLSRKNRDARQDAQKAEWQAAIAAEEAKREVALLKTSAADERWQLAFTHDNQPSLRRGEMVGNVHVVVDDYNNNSNDDDDEEEEEEEDEEKLMPTTAISGKRFFGARQPQQPTEPSLSSSSVPNNKKRKREHTNDRNNHSHSASHNHDDNSSNSDSDSDNDNSDENEDNSQRLARRQLLADQRASDTKKQEDLTLKKLRMTSISNGGGGLSGGGGRGGGNNTGRQCYNCGETGHNKVDCPKKRQQNGGGGQGWRGARGGGGGYQKQRRD